jgi:hypothetical protein
MRRLFATIVVVSVCLCTGTNAAWEYRLVNFGVNWGRIEARQTTPGTEWGTVCDDSFGTNDATVACRALGLNTAQVARRTALAWERGNNIQPIVMDDVGCSGSEAALDACTFNPVSNCDHSEDVIIGCGMSSVPLLGTVSNTYRLTGGNPLIGRLEVQPPQDSRWGTVCDDLFDVLDAITACRTLGLPTFPAAYRSAGGNGAEQGSGPIWMESLLCTSLEPSLNKCIHSSYHDCGHNEDILLACGHSNVPALSSVIIPPGAHRLCARENVVSGPAPMLFDVWTDASGTTMDRWNMETTPPTFVDRQTFAALHLPNPAGSMWGEGVAFAATMQTRLAWTNPQPNTEAYWEVAPNGADTWTFKTTQEGGAPRDIVFSTLNCRWNLPEVPSSPPAPQPHRVCLKYNAPSGASTYFDIRTDAAETRMHRWNMATNPPTYLNVNTYAALHLPSPLGSMWGEGVAFAATMQTRNAWTNMEPNVEAWWEVDYDNYKDKWIFKSTVDGSPKDFVFRSQNCLNLQPPVYQN